MQHNDFITSVDYNHLTFFYDTRSRNMSEIDDFLLSEKVARLQLSIEERAYIVL